MQIKVKRTRVKNENFRKLHEKARQNTLNILPKFNMKVFFDNASESELQEYFQYREESDTLDNLILKVINRLKDV